MSRSSADAEGKHEPPHAASTSQGSGAAAPVTAASPHGSCFSTTGGVGGDVGPGPSLEQRALDTAAGVLQPLRPIKQISAYLCAFHSYSSDPQRHVLAHHFCSHVSAEMHQCVIYDSNEANAKLIGIEYLISERLFETLPQEERQYWHSHKYEVASGMLVIPGVPEMAERRVVQEVANMYGKIIHTWQSERDSLPLGPPQLMMSLTGPNQLHPGEMEAKDKLTGIDSAERAKARTDLDYRPKHEGVDAWEKTGKGIAFQPTPVDIKAESMQKKS